jgi:hypothetical protein
MLIPAAPPMSGSPHDAIFKASFGQPDIAGSELVLVLVLSDDVRSHLGVATLERSRLAALSHERLAGVGRGRSRYVRTSGRAFHRGRRLR